MNVAITNVRLDLGGGRRGTDLGPSAIHTAGLVPALTDMGIAVNSVYDLPVASYESTSEGDRRARFLAPIRDTCADLADEVERAADAGKIPLVLGGDHAQAIGTIAGLARSLRKKGQRLGVVWVDAHTDMNTPKTTLSGNIHGMPLAVLLGHGPEELVAICGDEPALRPEDVALIGIRDVDMSEAELVRQTGVRVYAMSEIDRRGIATCIEEAKAQVLKNTGGVHLSFDLDGIDPMHAPGVGTPVQGGLSVRESHVVCESLARSGQLVGVEMVELNPTLDLRNKTGELAVWLIQSALGKTVL